MAAALCLTLPPERLHPAYESLLRQLRGVEGESTSRLFELVVANGLWGQLGEDFLDEFVELTKKSYGSSLELVDFAHDPERSRRTINRSVGEKTMGAIDNLIPPNAIDHLTRLVLTNAIYFRASWEDPFRRRETRQQPFYAKADAVKSAMMHGDWELSLRGRRQIADSSIALFWRHGSVSGAAAREGWS